MIRRIVLPAVLALTGALVLGACGSDADGSEDTSGPTANSPKPDLTVHGEFVPEPVNTKMAGGFLTVRNNGSEGDSLVGVTSELSDDVQLHETVDNRMRQVKSFKIPANGELDLSRGGNHLMFMELKRKLSVGDQVKVELEFQDSDPITIEMPVKPKTHDSHAH